MTRALLDRAVQSLLPPSMPDIPTSSSRSRIAQPGEGTRVGGDFYDVVDMDTSVILANGDVCGKGSQAAAVMALSRYAIRTAALRGSRPSELLETLNESLVRPAPHDRFTAAAVVRLGRDDASDDCRDRRSSAPSDRAGRRHDRDLPRTREPAGGFPDPPLHDAKRTLGPGDVLILYTDGLRTRGTARSGSGRTGSARSSSPTATMDQTISWSG
ncbi:MAG: PP2C family protein-serine/threonine phosphatase [Actinomycetota bacterium]